MNDVSKKIGIVASRPKLDIGEDENSYLNTFEFQSLVSRLIERIFEKQWQIAFRLSSQFTPLISNIIDNHRYQNISDTLDIYYDQSAFSNAAEIVDIINRKQLENIREKGQKDRKPLSEIIDEMELNRNFKENFPRYKQLVSLYKRFNNSKSSNERNGNSCLIPYSDEQETNLVLDDQISGEVNDEKTLEQSFKFDIGIKEVPEIHRPDIILYLGGGVVSKNNDESIRVYDNEKEVYSSFVDEINYLQGQTGLEVIPLVIGVTGGFSYYSWNPESAPERGIQRNAREVRELLPKDIFYNLNMSEFGINLLMGDPQNEIDNISFWRLTNMIMKLLESYNEV